MDTPFFWAMMVKDTDCLWEGNEFPIKISVYRGCSIAMFDYQRARLKFKHAIVYVPTSACNFRKAGPSNP